MVRVDQIVTRGFLSFTHLSVSISLQVFAIVQLLLLMDEYTMPARWETATIIMIGVSIGVTVLLYMTKSRWFAYLVLASRFGLFLIVTAPFGRSIGVKFTLLASLILDTAFMIRIPVNIILSLVLIAITLEAQKSFIAWNVEIAPPSIHDRLSLGVYSILLICLATLIQYSHRKISNFKKRLEHLSGTVLKLTNANTGFQKYANLMEKKSMIDERNRITSEIHDSIGYTMTNIIMMTEASIQLSKSCSPQLQDYLKKIREQARRGHVEIRSALRILRNSQFESDNLLRSILSLAQTFEEATGVKVEVEYGNIPDSLGPDVDNVIYHLVQESMTNSFRHGNATKVKLYFWKHEGNVIVNVADNGRGAEEIAEGLGLSGIKSRIEKIGGVTRVYSGVDGFVLNVEVPLS